LIARVASSNDTRAFGELIRLHQSRIRQFLRRLTRDEALADDLSQDVFMHAWDRIASYAGTGTFIGWLMKIAWTTFLQSKRRSDRYGEVLDELKTTAAPAGTTADGEVSSELERLLAVLTEDERAIMILAYACGLSHREIGEATDMPVGTVKSIIFRSKDKIREKFDIQDHQHG
jgi:RNA polymerase sigma-70 factor (ECF subfamily)